MFIHQHNSIHYSKPLKMDKIKAAKELALRFHQTYERLAPSFGYETRPDTKVFDPESNNGKLMIAVCSEMLSALSTQSPKWVKAKDRLPGDEVESLKEMPLRDAITKVPYHKVDILGFDNKTMYYRGINDEIHVKIKNIEWRESSTQPLQEKIDGLREDVKRIYDLHKVKLNGLKRNRMFPDENKLTDSECCAIDDQIQLLASILGDLNREILNKQP